MSNPKLVVYRAPSGRLHWKPTCSGGPGHRGVRKVEVTRDGYEAADKCRCVPREWPDYQRVPASGLAVGDLVWATRADGGWAWCEVISKEPTQTFPKPKIALGLTGRDGVRQVLPTRKFTRALVADPANLTWRP